MGSNMAQPCASVVPFAGQSHILIRLTAYQSFNFVWWDLAHSASYSRECTGCAFFMQAPPNKQMPEVSATLGQLDAARVQFETVRVQRCCISPCGKNGQFLFMSPSCRSNCLKLRLPTKQAGMRQRSNFHSLLIASCVLARNVCVCMCSATSCTHLDPGTFSRSPRRWCPTSLLHGAHLQPACHHVCPIVTRIGI